MAGKNTRSKHQKKPKKNLKEVAKVAGLPLQNAESVVVSNSTQAPENKVTEPTNRPKIKLDSNKIVATITGFLAIIATLWLSFSYIPYLLDNTDDAKATREARQEKEREEQAKRDLDNRLANEARELDLENRSEWQVQMKIGLEAQEYVINIDLKKDWAPKSVENFIRLANRKYYNGMQVHRMVKQPNFNIIQAGDPKGDGTGGESAFQTPIPDELWLVAPEFAATDEGGQTVVNNPVFRAPEFYKNFDKNTGEVVYPKGLLIMAKSSAPDSATSQFFITLTDTILPAQYTVFGAVDPGNFSVLDTILREVDEVPNPENPVNTKPSKDLRIVETNII